MKCVILAAGYATRLYPLTENYPKPLLKVGDKSILDWLIDDLAAASLIDEYVVISNHKYYQAFEKWRETKTEKIKILDDGTETNEKRLGAVQDLLFARQTADLDDDLLIAAGDNLLDFSLLGFLNYYKKKQKSCLMRYYEADGDKLKKCGVIEVGADDRVLSMEEKPEKPKSHWCCPPFYLYRREDMACLERALEEGCGADAPGSFAAWLCRNSEVYAMQMPGKRFDIGNLVSYENVKKEYRGILC